MEPENIPIDEGFLAANWDIPDTLGNTEIPMPGTSQALGANVTMQVAPITPVTVEMIDRTFKFIFSTIAAMLGEGAEFWSLKELESRNLAEVWHPILAPLLEKWGLTNHMAIADAVGVTAVTIVPRSFKEKDRRKRKRNPQTVEGTSGPTLVPAATVPASKTVVTETVKSGDSFSSPDPLAAARAAKPIV